MINILWLYNDLLDLYGDHGNITALTYQLDYLKVDYKIDKKNVYDELDFSKYNLVYIGPGKDKNLLRATEHLNGYADAVKFAIENGVLFFVTGNAQLLFGKSIKTEDGTDVPALGIFDYTGELTGQVFIDDFVAVPKFDGATPIYGFINRTANLLGSTPSPLFEIKYSQKDIGEVEGTIYKNFFGTFALGPVLAKNPNLLKTVLEILLDKTDIELDDELMLEAQARTLKEFDI